MYSNRFANWWRCDIIIIIYWWYCIDHTNVSCYVELACTNQRCSFAIIKLIILIVVQVVLVSAAIELSYVILIIVDVVLVSTAIDLMILIVVAVVRV